MDPIPKEKALVEAMAETATQQQGQSSASERLPSKSEMAKMSPREQANAFNQMSTEHRALCLEHIFTEEDKARVLPLLVPDPTYRYGECLAVINKAKQAQSYFGLNISLDAGYVFSAFDTNSERGDDHEKQNIVPGVAFVD